MKIDKNIKKRESFLIGDSERDGADQVISGGIKYNKNGLYDSHNEKVIDNARKTAREGNYKNIRMVTVHYVAVTIPAGIIEWKRVRETTKKYEL